MYSPKAAALIDLLIYQSRTSNVSSISMVRYYTPKNSQNVLLSFLDEITTRGLSYVVSVTALYAEVASRRPP